MSQEKFWEAKVTFPNPDKELGGEEVRYRRLKATNASTAIRKAYVMALSRSGEVRGLRVREVLIHVKELD